MNSIDTIRRDHLAMQRQAGGASTGPFKSFSAQLAAVMRAAPGAPDRRLIRATGMSESNPADGGYAVQTDFADAILARVYETGAITSRVTHLQVGERSGSTKIPAIDETSRANGERWGGVRAYWTDEGAPATVSFPAFRNVELNPRKLTVLVPMTEELVADSNASSFIAETIVAAEIGFKLEDAIVGGTGAGVPQGILHSAAKITIAKEGSQSAATITYPNIKAMWARLPPAARPNAVWLINANTEPQLFELNEKLGAAGMAPAYQTQPGMRYSWLFNAPVIPVEYCETLGTEGDIMLADLSQYIIADKDPKQVVSVHVRFAYDEQVFKFTYRVDGSPLWASPITPYRSTDTISPFVTLATRS